MATNTTTDSTSTSSGDDLNKAYYSHFAEAFDHVPFKGFLPDLLLKYYGTKTPPHLILVSGGSCRMLVVHFGQKQAVLLVPLSLTNSTYAYSIHHHPTQDIGSGPGSLAQWFQQEIPQSTVQCLDPCHKMVEMCWAKGLIAHEGYIQTFTPPPPLPPSSVYDGIMAVSSLIHVPRDELFGRVFERITNLLKPGGIFLLAVIVGGESRTIVHS